MEIEKGTYLTLELVVSYLEVRDGITLNKESKNEDAEMYQFPLNLLFW